jgi:hypothetical protein
LHCFSGPIEGNLQHMKRRLRKIFIICSVSLFLTTPHVKGEPTSAATSTFSSYTKTIESRLAQQHLSPNAFLATAASDPTRTEARLREGELIIEQLTPSAVTDLPGALLHHWRGTAFAPGANTSDFERLMRDFNTYPQYFSPQVLHASLLSQSGDRIRASMRVRQRHVITVVMDTTYDITFGHLDSRHGYSISRSTHIDEIDSPGTTAEHPLNAADEHGYLWRLNTYWSYEERDGGLYLQIEAVSLTRSIPRGLNWAIRPYVESIPRESLEFTLHSVCTALRR